jgi:hypothetical protein
MAILLRDRLAAKGYRVFLDIESLNSGSFNKRLLEVIENCTDVVVVCSKGSLDRCVNEGDWVRTEIAHALKHGKNVVPVMLRGFEWPDVLPDDMEELRMQNGVNANSHEYFDAAIDRLAEKFLQSQPHSPTAKRPSPPKVKAPHTKKTKGIIGVASLAVAIALVLGGIALFGDKGGPDTSDNPDSWIKPSTDTSETPSGTTRDSGGEADVFSANASIGDTVFLNDSYNRCNEWRILDIEGNSALIILDKYPPDSRQFDFFVIRQFLNNDFLLRFDNDIQNRIVETTYQLGSNSYTDKVFLLSPEQLELYMPDTFSEFRIMKSDFDEEVTWWLYGVTSRPSSTPAVALMDSNTREHGIVEGYNSDSYAIRPAMWIKFAE